MRLGVVILAAGASSRFVEELGVPKQLLKVGSKNLIQRAISVAKRINPESISVVLGKHDEAVISAGLPKGVNVLKNENWQSGMASSLRLGMLSMITARVEKVLVLLVDQPGVCAVALRGMLSVMKESKKGIVASRFEKNEETMVIGPPVIFDQKYFEEFQTLTGDVGAKSLIQKYVEDCAVVDLKEAQWDIDTKKDWENFLRDLSLKNEC